MSSFSPHGSRRAASMKHFRLTRSGNPLTLSLVGIVLVTVLLMNIHTIDEPDMGFHLSMGRWIVTHRTLPATDPLTYTVPDHDYTDMHWLYQILAWLVWNTGGSHLYIVAHSACVLTAFLITICHARKRRGNWIVIACLTFLSALASEIRFSTRPEVISWVFLAVFIHILENQRNGRPAGVLFLPVLMLLWVNIQGIYIIGLIVVGCYLLDDLIRKHRPSLPLWITAALTGASCMVNPYGIKGIAFPFLLSTRLHGENRFATTIGEFLSPWELDPSNIGAGITFLLISYYTLAVLMPLLLLLTWRRRTAVDWLVTGVFWVLAAQALRNIPLFCLAAIPVAAEAIRDLHDQFLLRSPGWRKTWRYCYRTGAVGTGAASLVLIVLMANGAWYHLTHRPIRLGFGMASGFLPVRATDFLNANNLEGRILNELRFGGYLSWRWEQPVFIDGRLEVMQQDFFEAYESARRQSYPESLINRWNPDFAVFGYTVLPAWFKRFLDSPDWRLVHLDEHCCVFLRNNFRDDIATLRLQDFASSVLKDYHGVGRVEESRAVLARIEPVSPAGVISRILTRFPEFPVKLNNLAGALANAGLTEPAEMMLIQAIADSDGVYISIWHRLADLYFQTNREDQLQQCLETILRKRPKDRNALFLKSLKNNRHPSAS